MRKEKMNNKGFSLVELIIVIAIMAILVVILAPQYLRYVERSRNSTDLQNATQIVTALQVYQADPESVYPLKGTGTAEGGAVITVNGNKGSVGDGGNANFVNYALDQTGLKLDDITCRSRSRWTSYTITVTLNNVGGLNIEYSSGGGEATGADSDPFADAMAGKTVGN